MMFPTQDVSPDSSAVLSEVPVDNLFYMPVKIGEMVTLSAMLDSGSTTCTINESAEMKLKSAGAVDECGEFKTDVILVGYGGLRVKPKSSFKSSFIPWKCMV